MSSTKKRLLETPDPSSSNKIRQPSPTSITESLTPTSPYARAKAIQEKLPGLSIIHPDTLPKNQKQLDWEREQEEKEHRKIQEKITDEKTRKNIKEGRYTSNASHYRHAISTIPQEPDIHKQYAEADIRDFKELDENKDWGLTFGGKKSKRKMRKTKRNTRKIKKTKRKMKKSKISKRKGRKSRRK